MTGPRVDPPVAAAFAKDDDQEAFLAALNDALAPVQESAYRDLPETYPTIQVIGLPRSGSTMLMQLISASLDVGYIDNLIACFWKAPLYGVHLSRKLLPARNESSFRSQFGRTLGINEPHEFGYFWFPLLGYTEMREAGDREPHHVDWQRVRLLMTNICAAFGSTVAFKNFLLTWHVREMAAALPRTCFVRVRRDPVDNALSLLRMRREFLGAQEQWASMKPREFSWLKEESVWVQVAGQVYYLERSLQRQLVQAQGVHYLECELEALRQHPRGVLEEIRELVARAGASIDIVEPVVEAIPAAAATDASDRKRIERAMDAFHAGEFDR